MADMMDGYEVKVVRDVDEFLSLEKEWNGLLGESSSGIPFMRHEWNRIWLKYLAEENTSIHIYIAGKGGAISAIVPLLEVAGDRATGERRRLKSIVSSETCRYDFIYRPEDWRGITAILNHWLRSEGEFPVLELHYIPRESQTLRILEQLSKETGYYWYHYVGIQSPYIQVNGDWESYFDTLDGRFRRNLRNRQKRIGKVGELSVEVLTSESDIMSNLEDCLRIESSGWKGRQGTAIACNGNMQDYYREITGLARSEGWLRLYFMKIGDRRIAFDFVLEYEGKHYLLKTGYDPEFSPFSPGQLLKKESIKMAFENGMQEYDFLGEEMTWKKDWTERTRTHVSVFLYRKGLMTSMSFFRKFGWKKILKEFQGSHTLQD